MTIAVTGATGFVGQALLDEAQRQGTMIRALTRRSQYNRQDVAWIKGRLADQAALFELAKGCTALIHVAGVVNAPDQATFQAGNVTGTANVIAAMKQAGCSRLIHVSSLAAREPGLSAYGASKAAAEDLVRNSGLDWTIVRPPAIYGPRDTEMFELFRLAGWRMLPLPPAAGRSSLIHVEDLARLLLALVPQGPQVSEKTFEPDDGRPGGWSHSELGKAIAAAVGKRVALLHLPRSILERVARVDMAWRKHNAKLTLDRVGYMTHPDWTVSGSACPPAELWRPTIATPAGLAATVRWYRQNRWL